MPLLEVADARDHGAALTDSMNRIDNFDWIVFTSSNAVRAFTEATENHGYRQATEARPKIGAVGEATAQLLSASGFSVDFSSQAGTAADLAATLPISESDNVLALLGDRAATTLEDGLRDRGAVVTRIEAYRTLWSEVSAAQVESAGKCDAVLLTSPAIARRFSQLVQTKGPIAICIGPTTADAARKAGLTVRGVATNRSPAGLIAALVRTIKP